VKIVAMLVLVAVLFWCFSRFGDWLDDDQT
jgi:hypothetical protein